MDELQLTDTTSKAWRVELHGSMLRFKHADGVIEVPSDAFENQLGIVHALGSKPLLRLMADGRRVHFRLTAEQFVSLGQWMGQRRMTRMAVVGFAWIGIAVGMLWILGALPAGDGLDVKPLGYQDLGLGVLALGSGICGKLAPMRGVLVAFAAWCVGASIDNIFDVLREATSPLWLIVPGVLLGVAYGQLRLFVLLGQLQATPTSPDK